MQLSILDQTPVPSGSTAPNAVANTIDLAVQAERLGYHRYWVAEHHNSTGYAGTAPEILIGAIAAATSSIRVGSGGVMLSHYSPLKVAEVFHMLSALHPGRIDLGLGRAPGGGSAAADALARGKASFTNDHYPALLNELQRFLAGPIGEVHASPLGTTTPPIWLLASSTSSATLAGQLGLPLAWAHFISSGDGPAATDAYRQAFVPSAQLDAPKITIAVSALAADTDADANLLATSVQQFKRNRFKGPVPTIEEALQQGALVDGPHEPRDGVAPAVVGSPETVVSQLESLSLKYDTDDITIVGICHDHSARLRSHELIAQACGSVTAGIDNRNVAASVGD